MIQVTHAGGDRLKVDIRGHEVYTDQPVADGGQDTAATPTELFVAGLAACIAYYAERFLRRNQLTTDGLRVTCDFRWAENPHRVGAIDVLVDAPGLTAAKRAAFERVIEHCAVHSTLRHPPQVTITTPEIRTAVA